MHQKMHTCLARRSGSEYLRGESGAQRSSFDLPHLRGLPCEAWINLTVPIIKGGYANLSHVLFFETSPCCCFGSIFRLWIWLMQGQDIHSHQGSEGKHYVRGMQSHKFSASLWVFLGRHSGLGWGMRRPAELPGAYHCVPPMLGELSRVLTLACTKSRTFLAESSPEHPQSASNAPLPQAAVLSTPVVLCLLAVSMPAVAWCQPTALFNVRPLSCPIDSEAYQEDVPHQGGLC